jgi:hypothetical protein
MTMPDPIDLTKLTEEGRSRLRASVRASLPAQPWEYIVAELQATIISERTLRETAERERDEARITVPGSVNWKYECCGCVTSEDGDSIIQPCGLHARLERRAESAEGKLARCREALAEYAVLAAVDVGMGRVDYWKCHICMQTSRISELHVKHTPDCILSTPKGPANE